ncbi:hypothetical protein A2U01_0087910, partial [Trifolium medium]|nr:hypothetical protein [Trifolium medium]
MLAAQRATTSNQHPSMLQTVQCAIPSTRHAEANQTSASCIIDSKAISN